MRVSGAGFVLIFALAGSVACSDSTGPEDIDDDVTEGFIRLDYSGRMSGSVDAAGEAPNSSDRTPRSMAFGLDLAAAQPGVTGYVIGGLDVEAQPATSISLTLVGSGAGTYEMDPNCNVNGDRCVVGGFDFIENITAITFSARTFELVSGSITITSVAEGRLVGTFSGVALEIDESTWQPVSEEELVITSGTFDVPMIAWADLPSFHRDRVQPGVLSGY